MMTIIKETPRSARVPERRHEGVIGDAWAPLRVSGLGQANSFEGITLARGLAATLVVASHSQLTANPWIKFLFDPGKLGVVLFFFISGFLIVESLISKGNVAFWIGRFFRLYPLYWISIAAAVVLVGTPLSAAAVAANFTMVQQFVGFDNVQSVYWTLTIEMAFYIFISAVFMVNKDYLCNKINVTFFCLGGVALVVGMLRWWTHHKLPVALCLGLFTMFFGAIARRQGTNGGVPAIITIYYSVVTMVTCFFAYSYETEFSENPYRYSIAYMLALAVFWFFSRRPKIFPKSLLLLGEVSFGLYLFHLVVLNLLSPLELPVWQRFSLTFVISVCVAYFFYLLVERPAIKAGRVVMRRVGKAP